VLDNWGRLSVWSSDFVFCVVVVVVAETWC
jgi:hypothetical protein